MATHHSIPVLVVNLDADRQRLENVAAQLSSVPGFALYRIPGVSGSALPQIAYDILTRTQDDAGGKAALGVFLAHLAAWEYVVDVDATFCLIVEDDVELVDLGRLAEFELPRDVDIAFCNDQMVPPEVARSGPLRRIGIAESLLALVQSGASGCGLYGYLLSPVGARKLIVAVKQELCFGHVDWRLLRYCISPELVEAVIPGTRVAEILRDHHHTQHPVWNVLSACTLTPALASHGATLGHRTEQDVVTEQSQTGDANVATVVFEGRSTVFHLTNPQDHVQNFLVNHEFYEIRQLQFHRDLIPMDGTVVDVGSYIGSHTLFYAKYTWARLVYPIEPNPMMRTMLLRNIAANAHYHAEICIDHVDLAIGAQAGWYDMVPGPANNLGATALQPAAPMTPGALRCVPLDDLAFAGRVSFLKIDTEGMELEVLSGASGLIAAYRPAIAVEVMERNEPAFRQWLERAGYQIIQVFWPYLGTRDFVILPRC